MALDPLVWAYAILVGLALAFALYALARNQGTAGLVAMLLASLAAGSGVVRQVRTEVAIERDLAARAPDLRLTRADVERQRREALRSKRALARSRAAATLIPLLLGALAALWRPVGSRVLAIAFLGLGVVAALGGLSIASRPLPVDRYDFPDDDEDAWRLAVAIDFVHDASPGALRDGFVCRTLEGARSRFKVVGRAIPPVLEQARRSEAGRCAGP